MNSVNMQIQLDNTNSDNLLIKQFNGLNINIYGTYEEPFFKARDIGDLLGIKNIRDTLTSLDEQCKIKVNVGNTDVGNNSDTWFLTEDGLYELLFISRKPIAKQFKVWIRNIIKEIRLKGKYDLEEKLKEHQQLLQVKELEHQQTQQELVKYKEKTYEAIEKTGHIYVIKTDAQGSYKVGKTKDAVNKRIRGLQTGNVNNIEILLDFKTSNPDLLEKCAHYILDRYRCNSNREFFDCDPEYIKSIITVVGSTIDTLKSCYKHISNDELTSRLESGVKFTINNNINDKPPEYNAENVNFYNWLDKNIVKRHNSLLHLKDVCESYLDTKKIHSRLSHRIRIDLESWIRRRFDNIKCIYADSSLNGIRYKGWVGLDLALPAF